MSRFASLSTENQTDKSIEADGFKLVVSRKSRQRENRNKTVTPYDIWLDSYHAELTLRTDSKSVAILDIWDHINWRGVYNFTSPVETKPIKEIDTKDLWNRQFKGLTESGDVELSAYYELYSSLFLRDTKRGDKNMRRNIFNYRDQQNGFVTDYHTLCYGYDRFMTIILVSPSCGVKSLRDVINDIEDVICKSYYDSLEGTEEMYENTTPEPVCDAFFKAVSKMVGHTILPARNRM